MLEFKQFNPKFVLWSLQNCTIRDSCLVIRISKTQFQDLFNNSYSIPKPYTYFTSQFSSSHEIHGAIVRINKVRVAHEPVLSFLVTENPFSIPCRNFFNW